MSSKRSSTSSSTSPASQQDWKRNLLGVIGAEFFGTYLLVCLPLLVATGVSMYDTTLLGMLAIAAMFGFTLFWLVTIFAARSGAQLNPAITIGLLVSKQIHAMVAVIYLFAQMVGGILGALTVRLLFVGQPVKGFGLAAPVHNDSPLIGVAVAFVVEFGGTLLLTLTVATVAIGKKSELLTSLSIGAVLGVLVFAGEFFSGGAFNPARALGPIIATGEWQSWWYILPEVAGGIVGVVLYLRGFHDVSQPDAPAEAAS